MWIFLNYNEEIVFVFDCFLWRMHRPRHKYWKRLNSLWRRLVLVNMKLGWSYYTHFIVSWFTWTSRYDKVYERVIFIFYYHSWFFSNGVNWIRFKICQNALLGTLMRVMWNVYQHYKQFLSNIQAQIVKVRQPIEKQLKVITSLESYEYIL